MNQDMSLSEIDNMIRIYSDKIFELQEQRAKLTGKTFYKLGATKKTGKTAYDKLQNWTCETRNWIRIVS